MNPKILSGYKNKQNFFLRIFSSIYVDNSLYILTLFSLTSLFLTFEFAWQFKYALVFLLLIWLILQTKIKNAFISFFLITLYTLPFSNPGKTNSVLAIPSYKLLDNVGEDYFLGYGLRLSNIFIFFTLICLFREVILNKEKIVPIFKKTKNTIVVFSSMVFLGIGLIGSLFYSHFPEASLVWLFQYMQLFLMAFFVVYFFVNYKNKFNLLFTLIAFTIILQSLISFGQFSRQSSLGLPFEISRVSSVYYANIDEANTTYRVAGTFHYHNQLALVILLLITFLSPKALKENKPIYFVPLFLGMVTIILTQSRTVWLSTGLLMYILYLNYKNELKRVVDLIGIKKIIGLFLIILIGLSYVIFPRLILSTYVFHENAGLSFRSKMFGEAIEAITFNPYFGYGAGTNEYVLISLFPNGVISTFPSAVHMAFLQLILEVGLLGTFFFFFPFFLILRDTFVNKINYVKNQEAKNYTFIFKMGIITFVIYYLFQPHVGTVEFAYLGIILGLGLNREFL